MLSRIRVSAGEHKVIFFTPASPEHVKKLSPHQFELVCVYARACARVCVCKKVQERVLHITYNDQLNI